ncbi:MAG: hypothetical protein WA962_03410 [Ornithinimicrobium sp.]
MELAPSALNAERVAGQTSGEEFNVVIDLANVQERSTEVRVAINDQNAVAVRVPGRGAGCQSTPIYRYELAAPIGPSQVSVTTDSGHSDTLTLEATDSTSWVVVQLQEGFPLDIEKFDRPPGWD